MSWHMDKGMMSEMREHSRRKFYLATYVCLLNTKIPAVSSVQKLGYICRNYSGGKSMTQRSPAFLSACKLDKPSEPHMLVVKWTCSRVQAEHAKRLFQTKSNEHWCTP